ncbi:974_t:CDS:10 [Ambispora gerdemannii]|uniref:974_t:CDS:1 n=1 Tax=Ambispora gerdemannii TaxID=144530 RepID=A0A9N9G5U6_9GLOM|nr:974_t:CDS:10 [Ambispora gerdemannii]
MRVKLVFDSPLPTRRCWYEICQPESEQKDELIKDLVVRVLRDFELETACPNGVILTLEEFELLPNGTTLGLIRENDVVCVKPRKTANFESNKDKHLKYNRISNPKHRKKEIDLKSKKKTRSSSSESESDEKKGKDSWAHEANSNSSLSKSSSDEENGDERITKEEAVKTGKKFKKGYLQEMLSMSPKHLRFNDDNNGDINQIDEITATTSAAITDEMNICDEGQQNLTCQDIDDLPSKRILELSSSFTPEWSGFKEATIMDYDTVNNIVTLKHQQKHALIKESEIRLGKFDLQNLGDGFIIEGSNDRVSTLEYGQYWADYPEFFADIANQTEEINRTIAVLRWYVSTLYGSFRSRQDKEKIEKKPFNPILGEQFLARWEDRNNFGETVLFSEQVSHHPPVSAIYLENVKAGVSANATAARIDVIQVGHIIVRMRDHNDKYLITLPSLQILGLWRGAPYVELSGTSYIQSQNYNITIEFTGKGWVSGSKNSFKAQIFRSSSLKTPLFTASGSWAGKSTIENHNTKEKKPFFDIESYKRANPIVSLEEEQNDLESRKLWKYVAKAINEGDFSTASKLKGEIEQRQRDKVKRGEETVLQYFDWIAPDERYLSLDKLINYNSKDEKYKETGSWHLITKARRIMTEHTEEKKPTRKRKPAVAPEEKTETEETSTLPKPKDFLANAKELQVFIKNLNHSEEKEAEDNETSEKNETKNGSEATPDEPLFTLIAKPHKHSTGSYGWTATQNKAKIKVEMDEKEV